MDDYTRWCQQVEFFLQSKNTGIRLDNVDPSFLNSQFKQGVAPVLVATILANPQAPVPATAAAPPVAIAGDTSRTGTLRFDCPHCKQTDQSKRVEGFFLTDSRTNSGTVGMVHSPGFVSVGAYSGKSASQLGSILRPPSVKPGPSAALVFGIIFTLLAFMCMIPALGEASLWIVVTIFLLASIFLFVYFARESKARTNFIRFQFPLRMQAWQRLVLCERCAIVFDSQSHAGCPVSDAPQAFGQILGPQSYK
jgi:hypothetical protein